MFDALQTSLILNILKKKNAKSKFKTWTCCLLILGIIAEELETQRYIRLDFATLRSCNGSLEVSRYLIYFQ